jgi:hypothetical protein
MPAGQPAYYKTTEELESKIDEYFNSGIKKRKIVVGKPPNQETVLIEIPTITGLAYFLGFESRQSLYDYGKREEFSYIIKKAQLFIEVHYEEMLHYGNTTGAIFALKNMGWKDSQSIDHTTKGEKIQAPIQWVDSGEST